jgi:tetratricopeptide (TPR) repeat protein
LGPAPVAPEKRIPPEAKDNIQEAYKNYALASMAMSQGNYEVAREYLSNAIENDPQSIYLCRKMALFLKALKAYPEASTYALKCLDADPKDLKNRMLVADLYALMGDDEQAIEQYNKVLSIDPENQRTKLLLTTILVRKGKFQEALHHLDDLIEQRPDMVIAHYYRGKINLEMGHHQEAEDALLETLRLNRSVPEA